MPTENSPNPSPAPAANPTPAAPTSEQSKTPDSGSAATPAPSPEGTDLGAGNEPKAPETPAPADEASGTDLGAEPPAEGEDKAAKPNEYHGAPEGDYSELTAPDGFVIDEGLKAEFTPIAKELDLSPKGVEKLIEFKAGLDRKAVENWGNHLKELKAQAQADPEIGGAKYQPAVQAGILARDKFGTPAFRKMLNDYGVGAHPEMIKFLAKVQSTMGEKPSLGNGDGQGVVQPKALHDILYKDNV